MHGKFVRKNRYSKNKEQDIYRSLTDRIITSQTFPSAFPSPPSQNFYTKPTPTINNMKYTPTREDVLSSLGLRWTPTGRKAVLNIERALNIKLTPRQVQLVDQYFRKYGTGTSTIQSLGKIIRNKNLQIVNTLLNPQETVESLGFFLSDYLVALTKGQASFPSKLGSDMNWTSMPEAKKEIYKKLGISPENKSLILFLINETGDYTKAKQFWSRGQGPKNWQEAVGLMNNLLQTALPGTIGAVLDLAGVPQNITDVVKGAASSLQYLIPGYNIVLLTTGVSSLIVNEGPVEAAKTLINSAVGMLNFNYENMTSGEIAEKVAMQAMILCGAGFGAKKITGIIKSKGGLRAASGDMINIIKNQYKVSTNTASEMFNNIMVQAEIAAKQLKINPKEFMLNASKDASEWLKNTKAEVQQNIRRDPHFYQRGGAKIPREQPIKPNKPGTRPTKTLIDKIPEDIKNAVKADASKPGMTKPKLVSIWAKRVGIFTGVSGAVAWLNSVFDHGKNIAFAVGAAEAANDSNIATNDKNRINIKINNLLQQPLEILTGMQKDKNDLLELIYCNRKNKNKEDNVLYQIIIKNPTLAKKSISNAIVMFDYSREKYELFSDDFYNQIKKLAEAKILTATTDFPNCDDPVKQSQLPKVTTDNANKVDDSTVDTSSDSGNSNPIKINPELFNK